MIIELQYTEYKEKKSEIWLSPITKIQQTIDNKKRRLHNDCGPTYDGQFE